MRSDARNLAALNGALDDHAQRCAGEVLAIEMNPYEVERLGWDDLRGIPIIGNDKVGTGRFRLVCSIEDADDGVRARAEREKELVA